jgi:hypothetical protein
MPSTKTMTAIGISVLASFVAIKLCKSVSALQPVATFFQL